MSLTIVFGFATPLRRAHNRFPQALWLDSEDRAKRVGIPDDGWVAQDIDELPATDASTGRRPVPAISRRRGVRTGTKMIERRQRGIAWCTPA